MKFPDIDKRLLWHNGVWKEDEPARSPLSQIRTSKRGSRSPSPLAAKDLSDDSLRTSYESAHKLPEWLEEAQLSHEQTNSDEEQERKRSKKAGVMPEAKSELAKWMARECRHYYDSIDIKNLIDRALEYTRSLKSEPARKRDDEAKKQKAIDMLVKRFTKHM